MTGRHLTRSQLIDNYKQERRIVELTNTYRSTIDYYLRLSSPTAWLSVLIPPKIRSRASGPAGCPRVPFRLRLNTLCRLCRWYISIIHPPDVMAAATGHRLSRSVPPRIRSSPFWLCSRRLRILLRPVQVLHVRMTCIPPNLGRLQLGAIALMLALPLRCLCNAISWTTAFAEISTEGMSSSPCDGTIF